MHKLDPEQQAGELKAGLETLPSVVEMDFESPTGLGTGQGGMASKSNVECQILPGLRSRRWTNTYKDVFC